MLVNPSLEEVSVRQALASVCNSVFERINDGQTLFLAKLLLCTADALDDLDCGATLGLSYFRTGSDPSAGKARNEQAVPLRVECVKPIDDVINGGCIALHDVCAGRADEVEDLVGDPIRALGVQTLLDLCEAQILPYAYRW